MPYPDQRRRRKNLVPYSKRLKLLNAFCMTNRINNLSFLKEYADSPTMGIHIASRIEFHYVKTSHAERVGAVISNPVDQRIAECVANRTEKKYRLLPAYPRMSHEKWGAACNFSTLEIASTDTFDAEEAFASQQTT